MQKITMRKNCILALVIAGILATTSTALAEKPSWAGGHARKWQVGRQLPRDVIFYDLPPQVVVQLGPPPEHHRYVRVASDILLIAVGTGIVLDAVQDLSEN